MPTSHQTDTDLLSVSKTIHPENEPVPAVRFDIRSRAEVPLRIRLTEQVPGRISADDIGFSKRFEGGNWTILQDGQIACECDLDPFETVRTAYYIRKIPAEAVAAIDGAEPELRISGLDADQESVADDIEIGGDDSADVDDPEDPIAGSTAVTEFPSETDGGADQDAIPEPDGDVDETPGPSGDAEPVAEAATDGLARSTEETQPASTPEDPGASTPVDGEPIEGEADAAPSAGGSPDTPASADPHETPGAGTTDSAAPEPTDSGSKGSHESRDHDADESIPIVTMGVELEESTDELLHAMAGTDEDPTAPSTDADLVTTFGDVLGEGELPIFEMDGLVDVEDAEGSGATDDEIHAAFENLQSFVEELTNDEPIATAAGSEPGGGDDDAGSPFDSPFDDVNGDEDEAFAELQETYGPVTRGEMVAALLEELGDAEHAAEADRLRERLGAGEFVDLSDHLSTIQSRIDELAAEIATIEPVVEREAAAEADIADLETELDGQRDTLEVVLESVEAVRAGQSTHESKLADLEGALSTLPDDVPEAGVNGLESELAALSERVAADEEAIQSTMRDLESVASDEAALEDAIADLETQVSDTAELARSIQALEERVTDTAALASAIEDLESRMATEAQLEVALREIESPLAEDASLGEAVADLERRVSDHTDLAGALADLEATVESNAELIDRVDTLETGGVDDETIRSRLDDVEAAATAVAALDSKVDQLTETVRALAEAQRADAADHEEVVGAVAASASRLADLEAARADVTSRIGELEGLPPRFDTQERRLEALGRELAADTAGLRSETADLRVETGELRDTAGELGTETDVLTDAVARTAETQSRVAALIESLGPGHHPGDASTPVGE